MSHETEWRSFDENVDKTKVKKWADEVARGHNWREGTPGLEGNIRWVDHICDSYDEAVKYIESHDGRSYNQMAVKYREYPKLEPSKILTSLNERFHKENKKLSQYAKEHSVLSFKAEFVGCPKCGSKLKRELLKSDCCPLCRTDMRSKTTLDTIERYKHNIQDLYRKIKEEEHKIELKNIKKAKIKWLVKIEYHT